MFSLRVNYTKRNHVIICICGFCFPKLRGAVGSLTDGVGGCGVVARWGRGEVELLVGRREGLRGAFPCKRALMPTLLGGCSRQSGQPFVTTIHLDNDSQPIFNSSPPAKCRQECEATPSTLARPGGWRPIRDAVIVRCVYLQIRAAQLARLLINVVCISSDLVDSLNSGLNLPDMLFFSFSFFFCDPSVPRDLWQMYPDSYAWNLKHQCTVLIPKNGFWTILYAVLTSLITRTTSLPLAQQTWLDYMTLWLSKERDMFSLSPPCIFFLALWWRHW